MFENLWNELKESTSEDVLLDVVTDELGNKVHIIQQTVCNKAGKLTDKSVMAVYPNGTLYPEQADKTVLAACHAAGKALKEKGGTV